MQTANARNIGIDFVFEPAPSPAEPALYECPRPRPIGQIVMNSGEAVKQNLWVGWMEQFTESQ